MKILFDNVFGSLQKAIDTRFKRAQLIVSNIANADTPHYKPVDIDFEKVMSEFVQNSNKNVTKTHYNHMDTSEFKSNSEAAGLRSDGVVMGLDGNQVDVEKEMVKLADNFSHYKALLQLTNKKLAQLRYSINEGKNS